MNSKSIEILAPVASWEMLRAAVHSGAGAVYFGMPQFNARGRTPDESYDVIKEYIEYAHLYGVRAYVAFNILIFETELSAVKDALYRLLQHSPDAVIVQDIGLAYLIKQIAPQQVLHASTQMTISSAEAIKATESLNISRYILARELSVEQIKQIRHATTKELEVFVHGALCIAYSGQCLTSESFGGRSGNRGQCAQSCRFDYDLIVDDQQMKLGTKRYLVSPKDLSALNVLPQLVAAGINNFKIEGRYKSAEYVVLTCQTYAQLANGRKLADNAVEELSVLYSRGFSSGWLEGINHQQMVDGRYDNHHGLEAGKVLKVNERSVTVSSCRSLERGDGVLFVDFEKQIEIGSFVYKSIKIKSGIWKLELANDFKWGKVKPGQSLFINSSSVLEQGIKAAYRDKHGQKKIALTADVSGAIAGPLRVIYTDADGFAVSKESTDLLEEARTAPLSRSYLEEELGALRASAFELTDISFDLPENFYLHRRSVKVIRQEAIKELEEKRKKPSPSVLTALDEVNGIIYREMAAFKILTVDGEAQLNVLVRNSSQLQALAGLKLNTVFLDYEYETKYSESIATIRALGYKVGLATARIYKPGEESYIKQIKRLDPDVVLVRNLGALHLLSDSEFSLSGDFSLNIANSISAAWFLRQGLKSLCPSYDLNYQQLFDLFAAIGGQHFEVTVHQYMPAFHMDYCLFANYLSKGTTFLDCGKPCARHRLALRDRTGAIHLLKADSECRNTMFNGVAQSAAQAIPQMLKLGVKKFRVEALDEKANILRDKIIAYQGMLFDNQSYEQAFFQLKILECYGISAGQLANDKVYKSRKKSRKEANNG
nr:U32 family peptidase [Deltaproteobacteria bacterium]